MQLSTSTPDPAPPSTIPDALATAHRIRGHAPAVTLLTERGREEQSVASLAQWAAKGSHLLMSDLGLEAGDTVGVDLPHSWMTAAVCLAIWWSGLVVDPSGESHVAIVHEDRQAPTAAGDVFWVGDTFSAAPSRTGLDGWSSAVQTFPDQPPGPRIHDDALRRGDTTWTQRQLLARAIDQGEGTAGVLVGATDTLDALVAVAIRPLVVLRPTVIVDGLDPSAASGDRVTVWI